MINEFFAVTMTSVYHVYVSDEKAAVAQKIGQRSGVGSSIEVGAVLNNCVNVAITKTGLQAFRPWNGERDPAQIQSTRYLGSHTSAIVALFLSKARAMECFATGELVQRDARFAKETNAVLAAIGRDHPVFCVCA